MNRKRLAATMAGAAVTFTALAGCMPPTDSAKAAPEPQPVDARSTVADDSVVSQFAVKRAAEVVEAVVLPEVTHYTDIRAEATVGPDSQGHHRGAEERADLVGYDIVIERQDGSAVTVSGQVQIELTTGMVTAWTAWDPHEHEALVYLPTTAASAWTYDVRWTAIGAASSSMESGRLTPHWTADGTGLQPRGVTGAGVYGITPPWPQEASRPDALFSLVPEGVNGTGPLFLRAGAEPWA